MRNFLADKTPGLENSSSPGSGSSQLPEFEDLARYRKLLQEFCSSHLPSLEFFLAAQSDKYPIFKLNEEQADPLHFRHITSSATCFGSIARCPDEFRPEKKRGAPDFDLLGKRFAQMAIELKLNDWKSDRAADVYCSCRGLPYVLSTLERWAPQIDDHLRRVFYQLDEEPSRFAIGEAAEDPERKNIEEERAKWYKPNAYHTYWILKVIDILQYRFKAGYEASKHHPTPERIAGMKMWARQQLGFQIGLHSVRSSVLDSDQLGWSLAILISDPQIYRSNLAEQDLLRQGLQCLFSTQESVGTWRHYAPLFHYPSVGNAYCYIFETFAAILSNALNPDATFIRSSLRQYFPNLIRLWEYATSTQTERSKGTRMWSSGHRINPGLESWATASVFEFAQALRQLVGAWTREAALNTLNYRTPFPTREKAKEKIIERSKIWTSDNLADRVWTMFLNPMCNLGDETILDPDRALIESKSPRSAILFGPPGTSKTNLVSAIAGAIGWKYIELHPSHFVADGLPNVQHTADLIFSKLMQLDHAVVLFDEIDELVRERDIEPDQFGRFLTTSMLPRLAELWKARRIMYFVATNHIEYFDRAVTRSERFDAIIFISPPSFEAKGKEILRLLRKEHGIETMFDSKITKGRIDAEMAALPCKSLEDTKSEEERNRRKRTPIPKAHALAKFAMLRWDELNELALQLRNLLGVSPVITPTILSEALQRINDAKIRGLGEYCRFQSDPKNYERFDASRNAVWIVADIEGYTPGSKLPNSVFKRGEQHAVIAPVGSYTDLKVPGFAIERVEPEIEAGRIRLKKLHGRTRTSAKATAQLTRK